MLANSFSEIGTVHELKTAEELGVVGFLLSDYLTLLLFCLKTTNETDKLQLALQNKGKVAHKTELTFLNEKLIHFYFSCDPL